jgi:hypothetical protein
MSYLKPHDGNQALMLRAYRAVRSFMQDIDSEDEAIHYLHFISLPTLSKRGDITEFLCGNTMVE